MAAGEKGFHVWNSLSCQIFRPFCSHGAFQPLIPPDSHRPYLDTKCYAGHSSCSWLSSVTMATYYHNIHCYVLDTSSYCSQQPEGGALLPALYMRRQRHRLSYPPASRLQHVGEPSSLSSSPAPNQAFRRHGHSRNISHPNRSAIFLGLTELITHQRQWSNTLSKNICLKIQMWC